MVFSLRIGYCESSPDFAFRYYGIALRNEAGLRALGWVECQVLARVGGIPGLAFSPVGLKPHCLGQPLAGLGKLK